MTRRRAPHEWPSQVVAERRVGQGPRLARAIHDVLQRLPEVLGTGPFRWNLGSDPPQAVGVDEISIAKLVDADLGGDVMMLADQPQRPTTALSFRNQDDNELIELALPGPREPQLLELEGMMTLVSELARKFGAHIAYLEDMALGEVLQGRRAFEVSSAAIPPEAQHLVTQRVYEPIPGIAGALPELLLSNDFDDTRVPPAVFWINWWNPAQIETLGRERVRSAGWFRVDEADDGALTLAASPAPPDLTCAEDVAQLRRILDALDLRAAQDRARR